jgi:GDP-4-dehydro-6-deoxy-D-mannose reductase
MLNACLATNPMPRFVFISSAQVYGNVPPDRQPIDESCPVHPINHYGASKAAAEMAVMGFGCEYNLEYMILRPFNHTGPGQTDKFVVPKIINAFKRRDNILPLGNTHTIRDFTDVRDVARAYTAIVSHFRNTEIYNLASGKGITIAALIDQLVKLSGHHINIEKIDSLVRKSELLSVSGNADKFMHDTGWSPVYDLAATLQAMLDN